MSTCPECKTQELRNSFYAIVLLAILTYSSFYLTTETASYSLINKEDNLTTTLVIALVSPPLPQQSWLPPANPPYNETEIEQHFSDRKQMVVDACKMIYPGYDARRLGNTRDRKYVQAVSGGHAKATFYVDDDNELLICMIPKVASTTLKRLFLYLNTNSSILDSMVSMSHEFVHNLSAWPAHISFKPFRQIPKNRHNMARISNYTRLMIVRHPLMRLVSAHHDKLTGGNDFYMKSYGERIIAKYRSNQTTSNNSSAVTLDEFFSYVSNEVSHSKYDDVHWSSYNLMCRPCLLKFDYILKLENWNSEFQFVAKKLIKKVRRPIEQINKNDLQKLFFSGKNNDEKWVKLLKNVTRKLVDDAATIYQFDMAMCGYDKTILNKMD